MEYIDQVKDYLDRCNSNLKIVQKNRGYEFTQLFSNFISTLIFIKENRKINIKNISQNGLTCKIIYNSYPIDFSKNTKEFIRHLRNACCHYGIRIEAKNMEIYKVIFNDEDKIKKYKCEIELTILEIENVYKYLISCI